MPHVVVKEPVPNERVTKDLSRVRDTVAAILAAIRAQGDEAVRAHSRRFDSWDPPAFLLQPRRPALVPRQLTGRFRARRGFRDGPRW